MGAVRARGLCACDEPPPSRLPSLDYLTECRGGNVRRQHITTKLRLSSPRTQYHPTFGFSMHTRWIRRPTWMSIATTVLFLGAAAIGTNTLLATIGHRHDGPTELRSVRGKRIDSLLLASPELATWVRMRPKATTTWALYIFRTDCPACASQKARMEASLRTLPTTRFATASPEEHDAISTYWGGSLPQPASVSQMALRNLGVPGVPALLIMSSENIVEEAWLGVVTSWPPDGVQSRLK
jgi:hypothetical protein